MHDYHVCGLYFWVVNIVGLFAPAQQGQLPTECKEKDATEAGCTCYAEQHLRIGQKEQHAKPEPCEAQQVQILQQLRLT